MSARKQANGATPAAEAATAAEAEEAKDAEGQAAEEEEEEEEEDEEEEEEEEEESSVKTASTANWADQRAARRQGGQRRVITRNDWSSGESMFDSDKWRSSEGDSSYVAKSSDEMSIMRESLHSGWMSSTHSGSSDEESDATSNSAAARRKARAAAAEVRRRMHPCERPPCRPFLSASPPFAVAARDFLAFLESGLLRIGGGPSAPWRTAKASQSGRPVVSKVKHRSAPYALGLREGYLITHVDATPVSWVADLMQYVRDAAAAADAADAAAAAPVADLRFRTTPLQSQESSSEESSDDEEAHEASSGGDAADGAAGALPPRAGGGGKGKGRGKGAKLPLCLKPAAKRGGPGSQTTWRAAQEWQQARLREGEEVAKETHDVLRDIMEKMKAAEERRAAARHALRKGRRLQGAVTVSVHRGGGTLLAFRGHPPHLTPARTLAVAPGGAEGVLRQTQGAWAGVKRAKRRRGARQSYTVETDLARNVFQYRDPVTGLGYSTAEEFAALRKSAVVAARFLQSTVTGEAVPPVDDVLRGGVPDAPPLAPVVAAAMAEDGVGPSVWRRQVGKFAAFSFLRLYGQSSNASSAVPASKRARRGAD